MEAWEPTNPQVQSDLLNKVEMYELQEEQATTADLKCDPSMSLPKTVPVEDLGEDMEEDGFVPRKRAAASLNTNLSKAESSVTRILSDFPEVETSVPSQEGVTIKDMGEDEEEGCFVAIELHFLKTRTREIFSTSGAEVKEVSERFEAVI